MLPGDDGTFGAFVVLAGAAVIRLIWKLADWKRKGTR